MSEKNCTDLVRLIHMMPIENINKAVNEYFYRQPDSNVNYLEASQAERLINDVRKRFFTVKMSVHDHTNSIDVVLEPRHGHDDDVPDLYFRVNYKSVDPSRDHLCIGDYVRAYVCAAIIAGYHGYTHTS